MDKKIKVIKTKTYMDSLYKLKDNSLIVAVEKKVNKLLENPDIACPMKYQHEGFCEIRVGDKYRVYCIRIENSIVIMFILGPVIDHKKNYQKAKEYKSLFTKLGELKKELSDKDLIR